MSGWIAVGLAAIMIVLIGLVRCAVEVEYGDSELTVTLRLALFRITVYPVRPRRKKAVRKEKKRRDGESRDKKKRQTIRLSQIRSLISPALNALASLMRSLCIGEMTVYHVTPGLADPSGAALAYGREQAACGVAVAVMENLFTIGKREIRTAVDFTAMEARIFVRLNISVRLCSLVRIAAALAFEVLKVYWESRKAEGKAAE